MEPIFLNQQAEAIRRDGFVTFANPEFAREVIAALPKPEFADVKYVNGVGQHAIEGYIYTPGAKRFLAGQVNRNLREAEKNAAKYRRALRVLKP